MAWQRSLPRRPGMSGWQISLLIANRWTHITQTTTDPIDSWSFHFVKPVQNGKDPSLGNPFLMKHPRLLLSWNHFTHFCSYLIRQMWVCKCWSMFPWSRDQYFLLIILLLLYIGETKKKRPTGYLKEEKRRSQAEGNSKRPRQGNHAANQTI